MGRLGWSRLSRATVAAAMLVVAFAFLGLDGRLGPISFELRRVIASVAIACVAIPAMVGVPGRWWAARWAGVIATIALVARGPSSPVTLAGFILALSAITAAARAGGRQPPLFEGLAQAGLCLLLIRHVADLVPQCYAAEDLVSLLAARYLNSVGGGAVPA